MCNAKRAIKYEGFKHRVMRTKANLTVTTAAFEVGARGGVTTTLPNF